MNDELVFAQEVQTDSAVDNQPWKILIVDDDEGIHSVTKLALEGVRINDRPLSFSSVYSAKEAKELLAHTHDFALIFVDVVMEHDQAGLEVVEYIREELKDPIVRVIIRTGEPGSAPERMIIDNYDINDYKEKTELNVTRLYTSVRSSLLQYEQLADLYAYQEDLQKVLDDKIEEIKVQEYALFESTKQTQMGELLSMIAHQWRQPLSRVGAVLGQMQMGISLSTMKLEEMTELLILAEDYVQNLSKIIKEFQNLYSPQEKKHYLKLDAMINNALNLLHDSFKDKGIEASVDYSKLESIPELNVELKQVFMNIIKNAFDEIVKKREAEGKIDIRIFTDQDSLFIEIEDNAGLSEKKLDQTIFEPYVSGSSEKHGKGLGLYICKMVVEKHCHGNIVVKEGRLGACFVLDFPLSELR